MVFIYRLNFSFKNAALRESARKTPKYFPAGPLFQVLLFFADKMFTEMPLFQENYPALKKFWLHPWFMNWQREILETFFHI